MASGYHHLEPFPLFIDSAPPDTASFLSRMRVTDLYIPSSHDSQLPQKSGVAVTTRLSKNIRLRYYQYEVTLGLYMLTPTERIVLNMTVLGLFAAVTYGLIWGLEPFLIRTLCQFAYYATGSFSRVVE